MAVGRAPMWRSVDDWPLESTLLTLDEDAGLSATGTQLGMRPFSYRADYELDVGPGFVTRSLRVRVSGAGYERSIDLRRDDVGTWTCEATAHGTPPAPLQDPGLVPGTDLRGALDCDLALSPLTNVMPIRRQGLHQRPGAADIVAAFVSIPDLRVQASAQRYEHVAAGQVRYVDRGLSAGFEAVLEVDDEGLVLEYPGLASRLGGRDRP